MHLEAVDRLLKDVTVSCVLKQRHFWVLKNPPFLDLPVSRVVLGWVVVLKKKSDNASIITRSEMRVREVPGAGCASGTQGN